MNQFQFPQLDRDSASSQLRLLGYQGHKQVYLRFFYPSDDPRKENDRGRKSNSLNWHSIEKYQREGRGVYFVVNGGGHKNEDVVSGRAIFIEHDNLPKDIQVTLWQTLNLPEPTFQVDTGGKSIHSYWVFEQPIPIEQWCPLQNDLLEFASADRSIKNPARVMRLAGAWHISINESGQPVYNQSQLVSSSGHKYSYEQLRTIIPAAETKKEVKSAPQPNFTPPTPPNQLPRHPDQIQIPVAASVPLEQCLAKESRWLLERGEAQGGRNSNGAKLALDLIGTYQYLQTLGQSVEGDPRQLLEEYAVRCTPPLPTSEVESIWKSALNSNPNPSCTPEGVEACIRGWYWREVVKPAQARRRNNRGSSQRSSYGNNNNGNHSNTHSAPTLNLSARLREIVTSSATESEQHMALMDLAGALGRPYRDLEKLAGIIRSESDLDSDVVEAIAPLKQNLTNYRQRIDLNRYLHPTLAKSLIATASAMPTAPEYLFTTLLSTSASCIGTASKVIISAEGGYTQPCIFWTGNVSHSGQMKTPPQQVIIEPLIKAESEAYDNYQEEKTDYEREKNSKEAPPTRKRYLVNNVTIPVKIRLHAENKRGLLEYIDELVSDFTRLNQYTKGKGDDLQTELGLFNGSSVNYDRSDTKLFLARTGISKCGTYQWDTLARLMADEVNFTASGYASRFLLCSIPDAPPRLLDLFKSYAAVENLQKLLGSMYEQLSQLPSRDYALSHEAKVLFQAWNHNLVMAEMDERDFGLSLVYSKIESYTARIALWLHIVNHLFSGKSAPTMIGGQTMKAAIEIASFYLWQHRFIQAHNSPSRFLEGIFLKAQLQAEKLWSRAKKGVSASYLKARLNGLKKWSVEKIRQIIFRTLVASGLGRIEGEGSNMIYIPFGERGENQETTNNPRSPFSPQPVGGLGDELVNPPRHEPYSFQEVQTRIGEVGGEGQSGKQTMPNHHAGDNSNLFDTDTDFSILSNFSSSEQLEKINDELRDKTEQEDFELKQHLTNQSPSGHSREEKTREVDINSPRPPQPNEFDQSSISTTNMVIGHGRETRPPLTTNFTNSIAKPVVKSGDTAIGAVHQDHHQPPIDERQINPQEKVEVGRREVAGFDFDYVIEQLDRHIQRVGGTIDYWKNYLREKYNVASRRYLSDEQIIEFWDYLRVLPPKFSEGL